MLHMTDIKLNVYFQSLKVLDKNTADVLFVLLFSVCTVLKLKPFNHLRMKTKMSKMFLAGAVDLNTH